MTEEQLIKKQRAEAELGVKSRLVLDAIIEKENITVSDTEIKAAPGYNKEHHPYIEHDLLFKKLVKFLSEVNHFRS